MADATSSHPLPSRPRSALPVLHAVTNDEILGREDFLQRARAVMRIGGPRVAVQLRSAHVTARRLYELASALADEQAATDAWLVINDRADAALAVGARGVQLTSRSLSVADAHWIAPRAAIGASIHSAAEARAAAAEGADWVVAGHVFETASHAGDAGRGPEFLRAVAAAASPVIAIGGVRPEHVAALRRAGAHGVAVIRGVWDAADAGRAATDYLSSYDANAAE